MSASRILRGSLLTLLLGFLVVLSYSALHSVDYVEEAAYARDLRRVQAATAELNERVLRSRAALMAQYDPLVHALSDLRRLHQQLRRVPAFLGGEAASDLRRQLDASERELRHKDELVEAFKTQNSVLQNSLRYFPVLANLTIDRAHLKPGGDVVASRIQALISAIMLFDTEADTESTARVLAAQSDLATAEPAAQTLELERDVELILAHSKIILEQKPMADWSVRQILAVPLPKLALQLEESYSRHYRSATQRALVLRQALFGLALASVALGLTEIILRIRRSASALELATTELRAANLALAREREKERQLGELKTQFVSMTSHEFRTPLSVVLSSTELLESYGDGWERQRRQDHWDRIRAAASSMRRMLDDILIIGRAEAGVLRALPAQMNLDEFSRHLVEGLEHSTARSHCIGYTFEGDPRVTLDERLLSEVVGNLLSNALKYSEPGSQVQFSVVASDELCRFSIEDQGIGIPEHELPRLFESFFRAGNVDQIKGSGLGLAVVKKALDVQGGTITVTSKLGIGTRFVVQVPRNLNVSASLGSEA
jgi:signal transduction histidine kinase